MFSESTRWHPAFNRLTELRERLTREGRSIRDLTASNPTDCGISYPEGAILDAIANPAVLRYEPDPRGLLSAREAVAGYYAGRGITVDPNSIFLTASTSEAYALLFALLCDPGDHVATPKPSYPLFEYLTRTCHVADMPYLLEWHGKWYLDRASLETSMRETTRAMVLVNPHNPTGSVPSPDEMGFMIETASRWNCALISDEVFGEYPMGEAVPSSTAGNRKCLTFTLNGISKMAGLPQLKLGWIVVSGPEDLVEEAGQRLEILNDTFLSVNTPVQHALPRLLELGAGIREEIRGRVQRNYSHLRSVFGSGSPCTVLECDGGWSAVLRLPRIRSDEEWALDLLERFGIFTHPGYFFDFVEDGYLVVSLLPEHELFKSSTEDLRRHFQAIA